MRIRPAPPGFSPGRPPRLVLYQLTLKRRRVEYMGGAGSGPRLRQQRLTLAAIGRRLGLTRQAVKAALDRLG
jgi:hypothetical protein